jgi:hypothetical protein
MKLLSIAMFALVVLGGCEKTSDLGAMKQEALGIAGHYKQRFEDLSRRADALDAKTIPETTPGYQIARASYDQAVSKLKNEILPAVAEAPQAINNAAAKGDREELRKLMYRIQERLTLADIELGAKLDAYDNWVTAAEAVASSSGPARSEPVTPGTPPPAEPAPPAPGQPSIMPVAPAQPANPG